MTFTKVLVSGRAFSDTEELVLSEAETEQFIAEATELRRKTKDIVVNFTTTSISDSLHDDNGATNYQVPIIRSDATMRLSCFEPITVGNVLDENIQVLWERYKQIRALLKKFPEKLNATRRNYVDEDISYVEIL